MISSILCVCTGNICRSPTAEGVLRVKLKQAGLDESVEVDSAGLEGWHAGKPPDPRAINFAGKRGYTLANLRARKLTKQDLEAFDMVVAMDRGHFRDMMRMSSASTERLFLFMEFAVQADPAMRRHGQDVPDPYYGPDEGFVEALDLIEAGAEGLVQALLASGLQPPRT